MRGEGFQFYVVWAVPNGGMQVGELIPVFDWFPTGLNDLAWLSLDAD